MVLETVREVVPLEEGVLDAGNIDAVDAAVEGANDGNGAIPLLFDAMMLMPEGEDRLGAGEGDDLVPLVESLEDEFLEGDLAVGGDNVRAIVERLLVDPDGAVVGSFNGHQRAAAEEGPVVLSGRARMARAPSEREGTVGGSFIDAGAEVALLTDGLLVGVIAWEWIRRLQCEEHVIAGNDGGDGGVEAEVL